MISLHPTTFYLLLEVLAAVTVVALLLGLMALRRRRHRRATLMDLVQRVKNTGGPRREGIVKVLRESGISDETQLAALAQQILTAETHFYQFLIRALLGNDDRSLLDLDRQVENLTDAIAKSAPAVESGAARTNVSPAVSTQINTEIGELKQVVTALQSSHQQVLAEVKSSTASVREALLRIGTQGVVAVAASAGSAASSAAVTTEPASGPAPAGAHDTLESLPDIDEALSFSSDPAPSPAEPELEANPASPDPAIPEIEQIAEIPDELLMGGDTSPGPASDDGEVTQAPASPKPGAALEWEPPGASAEQIAEMPDELLFEEEPAAIPPAAPAAPPATPETFDTDALIDELLADAAASSKATLASTTAEPVAEEPEATGETQPSLDEIYTAEPLIPDGDDEAQSAQTPPRETGSEGAGAIPDNEQVTGQSNNYGNVDDLLAELDDLLK